MANFATTMPNFCCCFSQNNRPRSIYQYSNMALRLSGQTSIFGVVFFVSESLLGIEGRKKREKICNFDPKASEPCSNINISNVAYCQIKLITVSE